VNPINTERVRKLDSTERDIGEPMPRILTSNLVSEFLRLDGSDVVDDTLVGVEITSKSII